LATAYNPNLSFLTIISNLLQSFLKTDLTFPTAPSGADIHSGFYNVWRSVSADVKAKLRPLVSANPSYSISFTGHSLGGAVATLGALDVVTTGFTNANKVLIYTNGAPRIGNAAFYRYVRGMGFQGIFRSVHYNDSKYSSHNHRLLLIFVNAMPSGLTVVSLSLSLSLFLFSCPLYCESIIVVPHLPPESFSFNHHLNEQWISYQNRITFCDDPQNGGEDTNCANLTPPWVSTAAHGLYYDVGMGGLSC
jgi:hypothetical protein